MNSASFACHGMDVVDSQTRGCFLLQTCKHLMHFTDPALRPATISCADSLMLSSSGTRLRGTATWDTKVDLLGVLLGHVQGDGNLTLNRPG